MGLELWTYAIWSVVVPKALRGLTRRRPGKTWKAHRKMFYSHFQPSAVSKSWPIQRVEAQKLLRRLIDTLEDFMEHLRQ